ncbi:hypothetical protein ACGF8B_22620 [Streptomyces sp. NPDC047917]|uniref:hypothetical protein n=1 Tax=Streptomyces sp. NPDC047917 TaxID=3365491 RepID=UPI0037210BD6
MFSSSLSRRPAIVTRTAAAVTGIALASLVLGAPVASAAQGPSADGPRPAHGASRVCEDLEAILAQLPVSAPVPVCKLVNGWD